MSHQTGFCAFMTLWSVLFFHGCATGPSAWPRFRFEEPQMGVPFTILLHAPNREKAAAAAEKAFQKITQLNQIFSDYETDSELSELSRTAGSGRAVPVSAELFTLLEASQAIARETDGAFDITVGPAVSLWRKARRELQLPDEARLAETRSRVGYTYLQLDAKKRTATLLRERMRLDLGGIAKGYAADEAIRVLKGEGIRCALVAASGDITVGDAPPGEKGWRVELAGYDARGGPKAQIVRLQNASVATSGDVMQKLEIDGVRYSHILNPFTGIGLTNHSLVSVIAKTGLKADPIATTLCILPPEEALAYAEKKKIAARIIQQTPAGLIVKESSRFKRLTFLPGP